MDIEFADLTVKLQTRICFAEGSSEIKTERSILEMSDPSAEVTLNEYMVGCYGTTEYPEDMQGIKLSVSGNGKAESLDYEYRCREISQPGADVSEAVIPAIETKVSLRGDGDGSAYIREGYAFSPMFTLGYERKIKDKEVYSTWLRLEKAN